MKCSKCGTEFEGNFCPECGTKVFETCSKCGAQVKPGQKFCQQCGEPLYVSNLSEQKNSNSDNTVNSVQTPVKTEEKIAQSAQTSATRTTEQNNVYAQSAMASAESQHSWATNSVAVNAQKFKSSKICNILALISNYIGLCAAALFALLNFAFLAADFYFIEFFGEKESISCYDALDLSGDPANSIITIIILSVVMLGVAVLHGLTLIREHKAKAYYYIFNKVKTDYIFPVIECLLMFAIAISGCVAASWINSNSEGMVSVGSGINCVIAFAFIWFIIIAACTAFNFFFVKYAPYGDKVMPKKERKIEPTPELTPELKGAYLSQVKASVSLKRSFSQLILLFILVLIVAAETIYVYANLSATFSRNMLLEIESLDIESIIISFLLGFGCQSIVSAVFFIVCLCMAISALKKIKISTSGKQLKYKYRFAAICTVFICIATTAMFITLLIYSEVGITALIGVIYNINFYFLIILLLISIAAFVFAIVVTRRQLAIFNAAVPNNHCDMKSPAQNLPVLFKLYTFVKIKEVYDDADFNSKCEQVRKTRKGTSITGYVMVALLAVAILLSTLVPYCNIFQLSRVDDISVGDSKSKVESVFGKPDYSEDYTSVWFGGNNSDDFKKLFNYSAYDNYEASIKYEELYEKLENATTKIITVSYDYDGKVTSVYFDAEYSLKSEPSYLFSGSYDYVTIPNLSLPSLNKVESELKEISTSYRNTFSDSEYEAYYLDYLKQNDFSVKYYNISENKYFNRSISNYTITVKFYQGYLRIYLSTPKTDEHSITGTSIIFKIG